MTEQEKRKKRCCFTGHRPEKLDRPKAEIVAWLESEIRKAVDDGFVTFISGMASPFEGFERSWDESWRRQYADVIRKADLVRYVCKSYSRACFQIRNEWMVDRSARVIAVFNGQSGGTKNTINYARSNGIEVIKS